MIQHAIINIIAKELKVDSRISTITEEGQGIDGYINNIPVQIKSKTYIEEVKIERINEKIVIIYYEKDNRTSDITFEYNESDFK